MTTISPRRKVMALGSLITLTWAIIGLLVLVGAILWNEAF